MWPRNSVPLDRNFCRKLNPPCLGEGHAGASDRIKSDILRARRAAAFQASEGGVGETLQVRRFLIPYLMSPILFPPHPSVIRQQLERHPSSEMTLLLAERICRNFQLQRPPVQGGREVFWRQWENDWLLNLILGLGLRVISKGDIFAKFGNKVRRRVGLMLLFLWRTVYKLLQASQELVYQIEQEIWTATRLLSSKKESNF